ERRVRQHVAPSGVAALTEHDTRLAAALRAGQRYLTTFDDAALDAFRILDDDVDLAFAVANRHLEAWPRFRDARIDRDLARRGPHPENVLDDDAIHPRRRARVPGPPAAPNVVLRVVDVRCDHVRLDLVALDGVMNRVEKPEQVRCALAVAEHGE